MSYELMNIPRYESKTLYTNLWLNDSFKNKISELLYRKFCRIEFITTTTHGTGNEFDKRFNLNYNNR